MSIECVGIDGKKTPLEEEEQMAKLVGGTLSPINIAMNAMRKFGSFRVRPCSFTRNDDVAVVSVQVIQQNVCQEWAQRAALRAPSTVFWQNPFSIPALR